MKEENMLDLRYDELGDEKDKDQSKRGKVLESLQKIIKRNRHFKYLTNNVGKIQKNGLRRLLRNKKKQKDKLINKIKIILEN